MSTPKLSLPPSTLGDVTFSNSALHAPHSAFEIGYVGFTFQPGIISAGVAFAERWNRRGGVKVSHTFIVSGPDECIEAHIDEGVARVSMDKYLLDPCCRTFFRKPRGWTPDVGARTVASAAAQIGCRYNTSLIVALGAADTWFGHWCNRLLRQWPDRIVSRLLDRRGHWICSQLVAYALAQQPEYRNVGVLREPLDTIDPQQLFEDDELFEN